MGGNWKLPVEPTITRDYCEALLAQDHNKPHAFATTFRYSSVMNCSRSLSYDAAGFPPSNPIDGPSLAITRMGSLLHEDVQDAYVAAHPKAWLEHKSQLGTLISGSADIVNGDEVVEIKTVGAFKFDQAVGLKRMGREFGRTTGKGPSLAHVVQGGMNALALGCPNVRIVYISREAASHRLADRAGLSSIERFTAEWLIPPDVWEPLVEAELERLERIRNAVIGGRATPCIWNDDGKERLVEPDVDAFPCGYCPHLQRCRMDGPGAIKLDPSP